MPKEKWPNLPFGRQGRKQRYNMGRRATKIYEFGVLEATHVSELFSATTASTSHRPMGDGHDAVPLFPSCPERYVRTMATVQLTQSR